MLTNLQFEQGLAGAAHCCSTQDQQGVGKLEAGIVQSLIRSQVQWVMLALDWDLTQGSGWKTLKWPFHVAAWLLRCGGWIPRIGGVGTSRERESAPDGSYYLFQSSLRSHSMSLLLHSIS